MFELGNKALRRAEDKLKALDQETRYKPEDRQYLIERWRQLKTATEGSIRELERARKDFADLLRTLQTNEDFIDELLQVREHEKALEVIHKLTDGIKDASDKLKKLLTTLKSPELINAATGRLALARGRSADCFVARARCLQHRQERRLRRDQDRAEHRRDGGLSRFGEA